VYFSLLYYTTIMLAFIKVFTFIYWLALNYLIYESGFFVLQNDTKQFLLLFSEIIKCKQGP